MPVFDWDSIDALFDPQKDIGSSAGNLAIPLAGLLLKNHLVTSLNMLTIDANPLALDRLFSQ
eukprot:9853137-Ditylum_brightwellii.AAC.1